MPVGVIIVSYVAIVRSVRTHRLELVATASRLGATVAPKDNERKAEVQTAKVGYINVLYTNVWFVYFSLTQ